jgi:mono/diheme cytochrome c family protein
MGSATGARRTSTPDFDVIGENMAPVQENLSKLTPEDRQAIAAYLKSLPPRPDAVADADKVGGEGVPGAN